MPGQQYGIENGRVLVDRRQSNLFASALSTEVGIRLLSTDTLLPLVRVKLRSIDALKRLRAIPFVSYVEPGRFVDIEGKPWSNLGCSMNPYSGPGGSTILSSGDILPWNFRYMGIDRAWGKSNGSGVLVGLVDTGVDDAQTELNMPFFAAGSAAGQSLLTRRTDLEATTTADTVREWPV